MGGEKEAFLIYFQSQQANLPLGSESGFAEAEAYKFQGHAFRKIMQKLRIEI